MNRKETLDAISALSPAVSRITSGLIRIEAGTATATGDTMSITAACAVDMPDCYPDHAALRSALTGMTGDDIKATLSGGKLLLSGRGRRAINCAGKEFWPDLPDVAGDEIEINGSSVSAAIAFVVKAASDDSGRPNLCGVHFNGQHIVATDGFAMRIFPGDWNFSQPFTMPVASASALTKLIHGACRLKTDGRRALFSYDGGSLSTSLLSFPFPPGYAKIVPEDIGTRLIGSADEILRAANAVASFASGNDKRVTLTVADDSVTLTSEDAEEPVDVLVDGPPKKVFLAGHRFAGMLSVYGKEEVTITLTDDERGVILFKDSAGRIGVLLPLKG